VIGFIFIMMKMNLISKGLTQDISNTPAPSGMQKQKILRMHR